jgi:outer membrane protein assembly factor BamB
VFSQGSLRKIFKTGSASWRSTLGAQMVTSSTPSSLKSPTTDNRLNALSPQGQLVWAFTTGDDVRASAAIGRDGTVYIGSFDGLLYAIRRDGTLLWAFRTGDRILSSSLVDASGAVLVGSQDDRHRARWQAALVDRAGRRRGQLVHHRPRRHHLRRLRRRPAVRAAGAVTSARSLASLCRYVPRLHPARPPPQEVKGVGDDGVN